MCSGAQEGKTDLILDIIGARCDQRPVPILYAGPTRDFVTDQFEPRLMALFDQAETLKHKVIRGRLMKKQRKIVAGVPVRLAHGGSSSALKSDPAGLALVDEYDEMLANIKGQGSPLELIEARGDTYADFKTVITSTPSQGIVDTEIDPASGLEFWKMAESADVRSGIWRLFQEGTRHHWAWPCLDCSTYFIPRFKNLHWGKGATPMEAKRNSWLVCPACGSEIQDRYKAEMNERADYVAPGQKIYAKGEIAGDPPDSSTNSFWVSGLASPFRTFGERAEQYLLALADGDENKIQTAKNAGFGETHALGSGAEIPEWRAVQAKAQPYKSGAVPLSAIRLTAGVDVQKNSLYYVVRGWGARGSSWLISFGQLLGSTAEDDVWNDLQELLLTPIAGMVIERTLVDSGFRPDKADGGNASKVYEFCRRLPRLVYATKGHATQAQPLRAAKIEVSPSGGKVSYSMTLLHLDTDFFKSLVHARILTDAGKPGSFHVPEDVTEEYCRQLVSEGRVIRGDGKPEWVRRSRENHFLDAEALSAAAGWMLRVHALPDGISRGPEPDLPPNDDTPAMAMMPPPSQVSSLRDRFAKYAGRINR